jgi:hypothetical protein
LQVKIWFQNRRAKERKQVKKREELGRKELKSGDAVPNNAMANLNIGAMAEINGLLAYEVSPSHLGLGHPAHPLP